jgi:uncharacterized protein (TIGR03032 family)
MVSPVENDRLIQLTRTYKNAMGMAVADNMLAVAASDEVVILKNRPGLAATYPNKPNVYDGIYIPTTVYNTGQLALHDMEFIEDKVVAVNTNFSCLSYIDGENSFTPFWKPPFITDLKHEDRCHLNGLAVENNKIKYVTALGNTNTPQGWRDNKMNGGILMEYPSGRIILKGLSMPHSPRIINGKLYLLNSAKGELLEVDPQTGASQVVVKLGVFARGMAYYNDYLFVGASKLRHNSKVFADLEIAKTSFAGIIAIYLPYKSIVGHFKYEMSVDEIYDVKIIENYLRPSILSPDMEISKKAVIMPDNSFWLLNEEDKKNMAATTTQFSYKLLKDVKRDALIRDFSPLLCPGYISGQEYSLTSGKLYALAALADNKAVAMTVFEIKNDNRTIIHSVFVLPQFRKQHIAQNMLLYVEKILTENNISNATAFYDNETEEKEVFEHLIEKQKVINLVLREK